jgi:hypothetical protein
VICRLPTIRTRTSTVSVSTVAVVLMMSSRWCPLYCGHSRSPGVLGRPGASALAVRGRAGSAGSAASAGACRLGDDGAQAPQCQSRLARALGADDGPGVGFRVHEGGRGPARQRRPFLFYFYYFYYFYFVADYSARYSVRLGHLERGLLRASLSADWGCSQLSLKGRG